MIKCILLRPELLGDPIVTQKTLEDLPVGLKLVCQVHISTSYKQVTLKPGRFTDRTD